MNEDEFPLGRAGFQRLGHPMVLLVACGDQPVVGGLGGLIVQAGIDLRGRAPIGVDDHEEGVAPGPGSNNRGGCR